MGGGSIYPAPAPFGIPGVPRRGDTKHLRGIVDMGSNGIRFSVSDLSPPITRVLPTIYNYRSDISLYNEQFDDGGGKIPISAKAIKSVIAALLRFKIICKDLGVHDDRVVVLATEATRTAINSVQFCEALQSATGIKVQILTKENEGRIGALGIASSLAELRGLAMDLGGGSTQITWMIAHEGEVTTSPKGAFSFPYGAAALTRRIEDLKKGKDKEEVKKGMDELREEMRKNFLKAYNELEIPKDMIEKAKKDGGFPLYLSGGGFRGWGYLLLYLNQKHGHHYPISIINGYSAGKSQFEDTERLEEIAKTSDRIFRVSDRRRSQVPAVAFLINVLSQALPLGIKEAHFCQGGVREGLLFNELSKDVRKQNPLEVATSLFARKSANVISELLMSSIPPPLPPVSSSSGKVHRFPTTIGVNVINALSNAMYVHQVMSKESASTAALYSTSTGLLSSVHGVSHNDRALLALILEARYQGELPPREMDFKKSLMELLTPEEGWWLQYLGKVALVISRLYPSGYVDIDEPRIGLKAEWVGNMGKKEDERGVRLKMLIQKRENDPMKLKEALRDHVGAIEKLGKRKHWIGGRKGWGLRVKVDVEEVDGEF